MAKENKVIILAPELEALAQRVIKKEDLNIGEARISYMYMDPFITKTTAGRCIRNNMELEYFSKSDFLIQMSKRLWDQLDEKTRYILMLHELMHVDFKVKYNKKLDKEVYTYKLRDHDVEDFHSLIEKYGIDWLAKIKAHIAADNDQDGIDDTKVKI